MTIITINAVSRTAIKTAIDRLGIRTRDDEIAMIATVMTKRIGDAIGTKTEITAFIVITASTGTTASMVTMAMAGIVAMATTAGTIRLSYNADTSKA